MNYAAISKKKLLLDSYRELPPELVRNLEDWFRVELTYTSNAIEGNTLSRNETAIVLEKGITVGGKTLQEHLEVTGHAKAVDFIQSLVANNVSKITERDILNIHDIILKTINDQAADCYRNISVRISGSPVVLPNPRKVPQLMAKFHDWLSQENNLHPVEFAGLAHYKLVTIHPFIDGNGRTARLLMNLILMINGYPPAIIRKQDRLAYISSLEKAQLGGSIADYEKIIAKAVERSLNIYLKAAKGESPEARESNDNLLKIGEFAKIVGITIPTIRHWTGLGLLQVAEITQSGYQLYNHDMIAVCQKINELKAQRLTLVEIKEHLEL